MIICKFNNAGKKHYIFPRKRFNKKSSLLKNWDKQFLIKKSSLKNCDKLFLIAKNHR